MALRSSSSLIAVFVRCCSLCFLVLNAKHREPLISLFAHDNEFVLDFFGLHFVVFFIVPRVLGVPMPQNLEQIVDVPVPQIMEETVEAAKSIPEERTQQRTLEETVSVPVPQIKEQIVEVGEGSF